MKTNRFLYNTASISMACVTLMLLQSVFSGFLSAKPKVPVKNGDLRQRIADLEQSQEEDQKDFFLIDTSLNDLDFRVLELERRADVRRAQFREMGRRIRTIERRSEARKQTARPNQRGVVEKIKENREF